MAGSILSSLLSRPQFVVTNATTGLAVMTGAKVKKVSIQLSAFIPRHPREDGSTITDTRVVRPTMLVVELIAPTIDDVEDIKTVMADRQNLYGISSKGLVFANMMAMNIGIKQNSDMLSAAPFQVVFKELLQENVSPIICAQGGDSDSQDSGIQILNNIANGVGNLVTTVTNFFGG